jgi:NAD(P)H-dependent flavin oxidoreductase YrpB (nitropropane dioxygenase family)
MRSIGADGVQVGSRFAASMECINFKENDTRDERRRNFTVVKGISSVRLIKNKFYQDLGFI